MDNKAKKQKSANNNDKMDLGKLSNALNNVLVKPTHLKKEEDIALGDWLELKRALSPINNFITKELTIEFINNLKKIFKKTPAVFFDDTKKIIKGLVNKYRDQQNVNGNGYDFDEENLHIIAEIKANLPYEGDKYGASQKTGLKKDLDGLSTLPNDPNRPKKKKERDLKNNYKFLVVLNYNIHGCNTQKAVENLRDGYRDKEKVEIIKDINNPPELNTEKVYIVKLGLSPIR